MSVLNTIKDLLISLGISSQDSINPYFPRVRDRDDVGVLRCEKSGVILLDRTDHVAISHYNEKVFNGLGAQDRAAALRNTAEDTARRSEQFKTMITGKKWMDVGCGAGGILDALAPVAKEIIAVEPQDLSRKGLADLGYRVYPLIDEVADGDFDVVTLFHVFEHIADPMAILQSIKEKLKEGGKVVIEVPHAEDVLISLFNNEAFKAHTFWSEHLVLHTRESLKKFLETAGFSNIIITGFQRYPLANHLRWLAEGKPGGHLVWSQVRTESLDTAYADMLVGINKTDTIIAIAQK